MRIDGLTHPKTKELAYTLNVPLPHAIGLLELMWAFVGQQTPQGNIGKWSNQVIAGEAGWQGNADEFVSALLSVGFLDESDNHRLLVHDWAEHCPNWVHAKLKAKQKKIIRTDLSPDLSDQPDPAPEGATSDAKRSEAKKHSPAGESGSPDGKPRTPHQKIVDLYHELCPHLPSVVKLTDARKQALGARWRNELKTLEDWRAYFQTVAESDFLSGRAKPRPGSEKAWSADFGWLIKQDNCVKVIEGKYDN